MKPEIINYKGFEIRTTPNGDAFSSLIYKDGEAVGGTFSTPLDQQTSIEKAKTKIDSGKYTIPQPKYSTAQQEAADQMRYSFSFLSGLQKAQQFFEKRLGKTNGTVIDFRITLLRQAENDFNKSQKAFEDSGGIDAALNTLKNGQL